MPRATIAVAVTLAALLSLSASLSAQTRMPGRTPTNDDSELRAIPTRIIPPAPPRDPQPKLPLQVTQESSQDEDEAYPSDPGRYIPRGRGHSHYNYFGGRRVVPPPGARGYPLSPGYGYGYGAYGYPGWYSGHSPAAHYYAGRQDEYEMQRRNVNRREMGEIKRRVLSRHQQAVQDGLDHLGAGDAAQAVASLTLAARLDQGDPACRIHLAQARLALGHYRESAFALRRALELQPLLLYENLRLERYCADPAALDRQIDALADHLRQTQVEPEVWFLLGYLRYQRGDLSAAHAAVSHASKATPNDARVRDLLALTRPADRP